jgi:hypothetical protein
MIKIVALVNNGGSKYHRVFIPLEQLPKDKYDITYVQEDYLIEEIVKNADYVYIHWIQKTKCEVLSIWKQKHEFKIVLDIDDYWKVPAGHYLKEKMKESFWQLENQLILADVVLCATEFLVDKCKVYNDNCVLRKNYIPVGYEQFQPELRIVPDNQKIKIGVCGSVSHLDDWLSIKGQLEKIKNDKDIQENCIFVVAGYNDSNKPSKDKWDKVANLFKYKANGNEVSPLILKSLPPHNYMPFYTMIDVILAPLEDNEFNRGKSELKLLESAVKSAIVISNDIYKDKGYEDYLCVDKDNTYYSRIKSILDRKYLNQLKGRFQDNLLNVSQQYKEKYDLQDILSNIP